MITAAEYRAWAEESLRWAGEATTANERDVYVKIAEIWLQSASRSERLCKEPMPTTEYEWVLPAFQEWRRPISVGRQVAQQGRGAADCGEHWQAGGVVTGD
jgi:hypothetical protein